MSENIGTIYATLQLKQQKFNQEIDSAVNNVNRGSKSMQSAIGGIAASVGIVTAAVVLMKKTFDLALNISEAGREQIRTWKKVEGQIEATGGAVGRTARELKDFASTLQDISNFGGDQIMQKVMSPLLKFRNIKGEIFERATESIINIASVSGNLQSTAQALGIALESPLQGLSRLHRQNITFSQGQKKRIKVLMQSNKLHEAQTVILNRVQETFEDMAEKMAEPTKQLKNLVADLKEELGQSLVRSFDNFSSSLIPKVKEAIGVFQIMNVNVHQIASGLTQMSDKELDDTIENFEKMKESLQQSSELSEVIGFIWQGIKTFVTQTMKIMIDGINKTINSIIKGIDWVIDVLNKIPGVEIQVDGRGALRKGSGIQRQQKSIDRQLSNLQSQRIFRQESKKFGYHIDRLGDTVNKTGKVIESSVEGLQKITTAFERVFKQIFQGLNVLVQKGILEQSESIKFKSSFGIISDMMQERQNIRSIYNIMSKIMQQQLKTYRGTNVLMSSEEHEDLTTILSNLNNQLQNLINLMKISDYQKDVLRNQIDEIYELYYNQLINKPLDLIKQSLEFEISKHTDVLSKINKPLGSFSRKSLLKKLGQSVEFYKEQFTNDTNVEVMSISTGQIMSQMLQMINKIINESNKQFIQSLTQQQSTYQAINKSNISLLTSAWQQYLEILKEIYNEDDREYQLALVKKHKSLKDFQLTTVSLAKSNLNQILNEQTKYHEIGLSSMEMISAAWQQYLNVVKDVHLQGSRQFQLATKQMQDSIKSFSRQIQIDMRNVAYSLSNNLVNSIWNVVSGIQSADAAWKNFKNNLLRDLSQIAIRLIISSLTSAITPGLSQGVGLLFPGLRGMASGGLVGGGGMGGDSYPTKLTQGQYVVNRTSTLSNLPLLQSINRGVNVSGAVLNSSGVNQRLDRLYLMLNNKNFSPIIQNRISSVEINKANNVGQRVRGGF